MTKPKLTPWFPASIKPVRVGDYEYLYLVADLKFACWWDGKNFLISNGRFKGQRIKCFASDQWRELAAKP